MARVNTMTPDTGERRVPKVRSRAHRLQILFAADAYEGLVRLKEASNAGSLADVLRNALRVYEWLIERREAGYDIALMKDNKVEKVLELIL